ncbi:MAG: chromosome segregation protein SMC [Myxococcaceae bacterium]
MFPRAGFVVAVALSLAACHKAVPGTTAASSSGPWLDREAAELSGRAEHLIRAQDEIVWKHWTEGAPLDLSARLEEQRALYTREALDRVDAVRRRTTEPDQVRALELLRAHFAGEYVALTTAPEQEAFDTLQASLTFEVDGQAYPLRNLERLLARERNALRRQALHKAGTEVVTRLGPAAERLQQALDTARTAAAYGSRLELAAALRRTRPERVKALAERILVETDEAFRKVLEQLAARELRLPFENVRARDLPRMFRSRDVDELFPAKEIPARAEATVRGLGIDLHRAVKIDDRPLPQKNPRPLALPVQIPDDVRLSVRPISGVRAQVGYLHELGHALHAAHTKQPSFELSRMGGSTVSRAFSELFAGLAENPIWLEQKAGLTGDRLAQYRAESAAWDLYLLRRNAGRALFALAVWSGEAADPAVAWGEIMSRALGVTVEESERVHHLLEADTTLASASALESTVLAHQLRAQLEKRFGPGWWEQVAAGEYLRSLWAHGTALDAEELARAAGDAGLAPDALVLWLEQALSFSTAHARGIRHAPAGWVEAAVLAR